ncbi:MAG: phosphatidylinositol-specific phospholipase C1-like protein [Balneolales bacterium]
MINYYRFNLPIVLLSLAIYSCTYNRADEYPEDCNNLTHENVDDCIRMNQIQVLGTHNSYKLSPHEDLINLLNAEKPGWAENISYEHRPLKEQLGDLGIRQIELDIFADPQGGLYSEPEGALKIGEEDYILADEMMKPGFKVIHVQDVDYRTTCLTFKSCIKEVRDWSLENPNHLPILVLVEAKEGVREDEGSVAYTTPVQFTESLMDEIDKEIWDVFSEDHVITPDEVRGDYETLEKAILSSGWPTIAQGRGRVFFALDNTNHIKDLYLSKSSILEGRALFVSAGPGEKAGAFIKMNNSIESEESIRDRVESGFIVRSRSDIPGNESITGDTTRREAALNSGAQFISTDFPEFSPSGSGYKVTLPKAYSAGRCNPVSAPTNCDSILITE